MPSWPGARTGTPPCATSSTCQWASTTRTSSTSREYDGARLCRLEGVQPALADDEPGSAYDFATQTRKQGEHGGRVPLRLAQHVRARLGDGARHRGRRCRTSSRPSCGASSAPSTTPTSCSTAPAAPSSTAASRRACATWRGSASCSVRAGPIDVQQVVPSWWLDDVRRNGDKAAFAAAADTWGDGALATTAARTGAASGYSKPTTMSPSAASAGSASACTSTRRPGSWSPCSRHGPGP